MALSSGAPGDATFVGADAAWRLVREVEADIVLAAMVGVAGLPAALEAARLGRDVALANKETLVAGGGLQAKAAAQLQGEGEQGGLLGEAGGGELFTVAAAFDEGVFEGGDLAIEEEIGLVDEADERVGADGWVGVVEPRGVEEPAIGVGEIC